jgi:ribosomal protein S18 acetylase RimI-like enzyme
MHIRPMTQDDVAAVARLCHQLGYQASSSEIYARIAQLAGSPLDALFVGEEQRTVLAWIHVRTAITLTSSARAEIVGLVVDAEARHRGLGRALVRHVEAWAQQAGVRAMRVRSAVSRDDAHSFYNALGYRAVKRQDVFDKMLDADPVPGTSHAASSTP